MDNDMKEKLIFNLKVSELLALQLCRAVQSKNRPHARICGKHSHSFSKSTLVT